MKLHNRPNENGVGFQLSTFSTFVLLLVVQVVVYTTLHAYGVMP